VNVAPRGCFLLVRRAKGWDKWRGRRGIRFHWPWGRRGGGETLGVVLAGSFVFVFGCVGEYPPGDLKMRFIALSHSIGENWRGLLVGSLGILFF